MATEFQPRPGYLEVLFYGHVTIEQTRYLRTQSHLKFATKVLLNYAQVESFDSIVWALLEAANVVNDLELTALVVTPRTSDASTHRVFSRAFGDERLLRDPEEASLRLWVRHLGDA